MRLKVSKSKSAASLYVTKTVYEGKKERTITVEKLGTEKELREKLGGEDPYVWARAYIEKLNQQEQQSKREIIARYSPVKQIEKEQTALFSGGYLFLQDIYYDLKLDVFCKDISRKYKFQFDLNEILSYLVYGRILFPSSKKATTELTKDFIEPASFELQHVYRGLEILAKESDSLQSSLCKNSRNVVARNTSILYYDCTNFFFEIEQEDGIKQYGLSKEHRPNPIVQMGLFMDGNGIPLAFSLHSGNTNEQTTLRPLEKKILNDFALCEFVVCTDAGLSSTANRIFNDSGNRAFVTTQSVKKLKDFLKEWALEPTGWHLSLAQPSQSKKTYDITELSRDIPQDRQKVFYKERWIKEDGLEQKLIITYSLKHALYQESIRNKQVIRAQKALAKKTTRLTRVNQNDFKRFVKSTAVTQDGEIAQEQLLSLDASHIEAESLYDGFYAVCTNLESTAEEIVAINRRRWEIEESFRIMKSELRSRPVYLSREDRITAHFCTCFLSLVIYRILEKRLDEKFTCQEILKCLRSLSLTKLPGEGYIPSYTRTDLTDSLHDAFGFRTDTQIVSAKDMKKILRHTKS